MPSARWPLTGRSTACSPSLPDRPASGDPGRAAANSATLEQELMPISIGITGNVAVVSYYYKVARGNDDTLTTTTYHRR